MLTIGQRITVESETHDFEGELLAGLDLDGQVTNAFGVEVDTDCRFTIRCSDDGEVIRVNGWLASYIGAAD